MSRKQDSPFQEKQANNTNNANNANKAKKNAISALWKEIVSRDDDSFTHEYSFDDKSPWHLGSPREQRDKAKDFFGTLKRLLGYVRREYKLFLIASILTALGTLVGLAGPRESGLAINAMSAGQSSAQNEVLHHVLLMIGIYVVASLLMYIATLSVNRATKKVSYTMRQETFDKIIDLPISYLDTHSTGDLVSRISYDIDVVAMTMNNDVTGLLNSFITVIGAFVMMMTLSPTLSLLFAITLPITIWFTAYRMKKSKPIFRERSKQIGNLNGFVEEVLSGQRTITSYGQEAYFTERFQQQNDLTTGSYYSADYQGSFNGPSIMFITNVSLALLSIFGGILYLNGQISIGDLSAFVLYSRRFSGPISDIAGLTVELQSATSAAERVFRLLQQPSEKKDAPDANPIGAVDGNVSFQGVSFGYDAETPILEDMDFDVTSGSTIAIVGPTGAGKTTIVNLLMRFYDPQSGSILVDGKDISQVTRSSLRRSFAMVLQDTWVFQGTYFDNIAYGKPDATLEEVRAAAKAAHIDAFIEIQPGKYDAMILDASENISQGQRQLLTIARAMLIDAPILILDEATSNVDSKTEEEIQQAMNRLMQGRTSFVIAHRLSTIQNADQIFVVQDGRIVEKGTHRTLLEKKGLYEDLYQSQFA